MNAWDTVHRRKICLILSQPSKCAAVSDTGLTHFVLPFDNQPRILKKKGKSLKCSYCAVANMPGANFCQGCGRPLSVPFNFDLPPQPNAQPPNAQPPNAQPQSQQHVCFRCSAPLNADAKVCEKCGLNVENLINTPAPQLPPGTAAGLAEVTFFSQPAPPDPRLLALKAYAGWFAAILFAFLASFAAYSWLEASNVIGRLIGDDAGKTQVRTLEPLTVAVPRAIPAPAANRPALEKTNVQDKAAAQEDEPASDAAATVATAPADVTPTASAMPDNNVPNPGPKPKESSSNKSAVPDNTAAPAKSTLPPMPKAESVALPADAPALPSADTALQTAAPEVAQTQQDATPDESAAVSTAAVAPPAETAEAPRPKPKRHVVVTQIELNKKQNGGKAANGLEDFFRRWKKSIKQGVSSRPCTQQEKALNQCN
ncbi:MAG TPA: zinc ribbon domain-containing protein [Methylophilaceae bacterium]|nr:zinc ribbon domain-containing protein [Methylophilaceae bacterium]